MTVHLLSLMLLAFAVSLDGLGVGVAYGLRRIRIPVVSVLIIACCSGFVIWVSMQAGAWLTGYLSPVFAKTLGAMILIGVGGWALVQFWRNRAPGEAIAHDGKLRGAPGSGLEAVDRHAAPRASTVCKLELKRLGLVIHILRKPQAADVDRSGTISASEAVLLGSALSLDAFGAGLGAAMIGFSPLMTAILIAVSCGMFLLCGIRLGIRFAGWRGSRALSVLPALILILMGITRLL